jgi:hypothetical protein
MYATRNNPGSDKRLPWAGDVSMSSLARYAVDRRYRDVAGNLSGRLSYRVSISDADTNNAFPDNTDLGYSGKLLFTSGSYCAYAPEEKIWYDNWKDHLFYAVAGSFKPSASWQWWFPLSCPACLKISNTPDTATSSNYAAVVIFAGEKLHGQNRNTLSDKSDIRNYLEGRNAANHPNSGGNSNYEAAEHGSGFNDIVYAIDKTGVVHCAGAGGAMQVLILGSPPPAPPGDPAAYAACP